MAPLDDDFGDMEEEMIATLMSGTSDFSSLPTPCPRQFPTLSSRINLAYTRRNRFQLPKLRKNGLKRMCSQAEVDLELNSFAKATSIKRECYVNWKSDQNRMYSQAEIDLELNSIQEVMAIKRETTSVGRMSRTVRAVRLRSTWN